MRALDFGSLRKHNRRSMLPLFPFVSDRNFSVSRKQRTALAETRVEWGSGAGDRGSDIVSTLRRVGQGRDGPECVRRTRKRSKSEDLVLPRPFNGQVTEARNPQTMRQLPIDCGFNEIGRKESQRDHHVDLKRAASVTLGDAVG